MKQIERIIKNIKKCQDKDDEYAKRLCLCFVAIIAFFLIVGILLPDSSFSDIENRSLQRFPKLTLREYSSGRFEKKFDQYINDQFVGRNFFIKLKSAVDVSAGSVYSNGVWKGKDGYLIEDVIVPSDKRINKIIKSIGKFKKEHESIPMNFMLVPTAANIYSDKLPMLSGTADQNKYMDEFFGKLKKINVDAIDIRPAFCAAPDDVQLYYRTDHHWTTDGAKLAADEFIKSKNLAGKNFKLYEVKNDFVGSLAAKSGFTGGKADIIKLTALEGGLNSSFYYEDIQKKTSKYYKMSNLDKRDAYTVFGGKNHPICIIKTPTSSNRRLLLIKDSYANSMIPFLTQYYREIVVVDPRYYYDDIHVTMLTENLNEVLFLYNANTLFEDDALAMMLE